ncbi:FAD:protein FMN transferase [Kangiella sp. HZ709]|uniref:FAD:protein FMN transferase n=1 Tax=Kangiella sp. HZ709 TaxID=2666328 RepID=UPI0012AF642B|nr:FAD:protein FMN transferase [Kangiella sp. HZ709]MRX27773.1 FAD:protein FMN transferase [Kangiella sp. HZ709]
MTIRKSFFSLFIIFVFSSCSNQADYKKIIGSTMGTSYSIIAKVTDQDIQLIHQTIEAELEDINQLMSTYVPNSEINQFNNLKEDSCFKFSEKTWQVLLASKQIYEETEGAFDITLGPLISRWGFSAEEYQQQVPNEAEIKALLAVVGTDKLDFNTQAQCVTKSIPSMSINLSAIAKGYAVDQLAKILEENNIQDYLVEIGGEVKAKGLKQNRLNWKIAVEKPSNNVNRNQSVVVNLFNISIATSGDYRNYYEVDGKRFSHTIDPTSGFPVKHNLTSISVLHPSNMYADAYATALNVLGQEKAYAFAEQHNLAIYTITQQSDTPKTRSNNRFDAYISR